jgi:hypothetical protein
MFADLSSGALRSKATGVEKQNGLALVRAVSFPCCSSGHFTKVLTLQKIKRGYLGRNDNSGKGKQS